MGRTAGQTTQDSNALNNAMNSPDLTMFIQQDTRRFAFAYSAFGRINQMLGHETSLSKCKRTEIMQNVLAGYIAMK